MENKNTQAKKKNTADIIGIVCGVLIIVFAILAGVMGNMSKTAGVSGSAIPADALTLYGSAIGRNDVVNVKVIATEDTIYQIKVTDNKETKDIGTVATNRMPQKIYDAQSLAVDAVSGATITSDAVKTAVINALMSGGISPYNFDGTKAVANVVANKAETGVKVQVLTAQDWADKYPNEYKTYMQNEENSEVIDYIAAYPMIKVLYENYGFSKSYGSARGHFYDVDDLYETGRPHALANCFTCKTPNFTAMANELGDAAYSMKFTDVMQNINEPISCYNCHANNPEEVTVTHQYLINGVGTDFDKIDAATLACGQCHVEYYFNPDTKATTLPHSDIDSMSPDAILEYYNNYMVNGEAFADFTNERTGVRQIKVQHPEFETYLGEGSQHRGKYTCADCHMATERAEDGTKYKSHYLTSPLQNTKLIASECSTCHTDLVAEITALQTEVDAYTTDTGNKLLDLTEKLAAAVSANSLSADKLAQVRELARNAQFYWDFVFVENSNGAHNSTLTYQCLDKSNSIADQALELLK